MRSARRLRYLTVAVTSCFLACGQPPIAWNEPTLLPVQLSNADVLAFDSQQRLVGQDAPKAPTSTVASRCEESTRVARDSVTGDWYMAWWGLRADSTADVLASHSRDGISWNAPVRVDTADVGRVGCDRPPLSVAASGGNFHVVYAMTAREGAGIFASHSMDRAKLFHSPVAVVYGDRIGRAAVAANGDIVVIAYEDPNTEPRRIALALSRTMGHLFQSRMPVSPPAGHASAPAVALGHRKVAVSWLQGSTGYASPQRMVRVGDIR